MFCVLRLLEHSPYWFRFGILFLSPGAPSCVNLLEPSFVYSVAPCLLLPLTSSWNTSLGFHSAGCSLSFVQLDVAYPSGGERLRHLLLLPVETPLPFHFEEEYARMSKRKL
jgi:hypothetical protein